MNKDSAPFFLRHPLKMSYLCGMKRELKTRGKRTWAATVMAVAVVAAAIAVVAGGMAAWRHDRVMRAALRDLQAANQADTVFTSDSAAKVLVRYFDHPWHRPNNRMLAHYLLGRAHADMGEAPQAIEDYQTAVERADTTDDECDFRVLRNVWGQMAEVYDAQDLPEDELKAQQRFNHYSWVIGDTLEALDGLRRLERVYYLKGRRDSILLVDYAARDLLLNYGDTQRAAATLITPSYIYLENGEYDRAKEMIDIVRKEAGIFDADGILKPGKEMFYYTLGLYHEGVGQLDSAEYYYRKLLPAEEYEAAYKGLLAVYGKLGITDSIAKFAQLYADANDAMHDQLRTDEVHRTQSLYNYNRHLQEAREEQVKAQSRLIAIYFTLFIIVGLIALIYFLHSRNLRRERKREHAINVLQSKYIKTLKEYENLILLSERHRSRTNLLERQLHDIQEQKEQLELLTKSLQEKEDKGRYYASDIVQKMQAQAIYREKCTPMKELIQLRQIFDHTFPRFRSFVSNTHSLTDCEWFVCILTDLGLGNNDMAFLLDLTPQRINNIKRQANHNLFGDEGSATLQANLRAVIHEA